MISIKHNTDNFANSKKLKMLFEIIWMYMFIRVFFFFTLFVTFEEVQRE